MKYLVLLIFLLLVALGTPTPTRAACVQQTPCPSDMTACGVLGLGSWCCDEAQECRERRQRERSEAQLENFCDTSGNPDKCKECFEKDPPEAWTAIGCISTEPSGFISKFLGLAIGIAGGIAFLLILFGGFQILTSAGNPEQLNAGRELVSSAVAGLLLIIFSLFLLQLIGVQILGIPGFR